MKMATLHEKFIRIKAEELLKKMTAPVNLLDAAEEEVLTATPSPDTRILSKEVQHTIDRAEQIFERFGLTEDRQEALFQMPMVQKFQDEIVVGVFREREELERTIGKPRHGWDLLPFEKIVETEKILRNWRKEEDLARIKEIRVDKVFDASARDQIAAIQRRLSESLESVKNASKKIRESWKLPSLHNNEPPIKVASAVLLPVLSEKKQINIDVPHHYEDTLRIIAQQEDALAEAIQNAALNGDHCTEVSLETTECAELSKQEIFSINGNERREESKIRPVEAIVEDIDKMAHREKVNEKNGPQVTPVPLLSNEMQTGYKKVSVRPHSSIVISALKSQRQHAQVETIPADKTGLTEDFFARVTLPQLPSSTANNGENNADVTDKLIEVQRRGTGFRMFHL